MNEDSREPTPESSPPGEAPEIERRSLDLVFQGAEAFGVLAGGVGGLAAGVGKLKETFGSGSESSEPPPPASDTPASPNESE
jgi:hypothetical protein